MKKKLTVIIFVISLLILSTVPAFATSNNNTEIKYFTDGSYAVIKTTETTQISLFATTSTKSAKRTYTYYTANDTKTWDFTLNATFSYDGSSAKASVATTDYNVYVTGWKCSSRSASMSGATATGIATFSKNLTVKEISIGLKCSASGEISAA